MSIRIIITPVLLFSDLRDHGFEACGSQGKQERDATRIQGEDEEGRG